MTKETKEEKKVQTETTVEVNTEKKTESKTEVKKSNIEDLKRQVRRSNTEYKGRLFIDDKYKRPGKVLRIDNDDPATRNYLEGLGYTIVQRQVEVGSGSLSEPNNMGSAVHIEQGIMHSQPGILYEIDEDLYRARKEVEVEDNNALLAQKIAENQGHKS